MSIDKLKTKFFTGAWLTDVKHYFTKINEIIDYLNGNGSSGDGSYKVYTALLTQSGTSAPTAKVMNNTLGSPIIWSYESEGNYVGTCAGKFTLNKTFIPTTYFKQKQHQPQGWDYSINDINTIFVKTKDGIDPSQGVDSIIEDSPIEIRVYN